MEGSWGRIIIRSLRVGRDDSGKCRDNKKKSLGRQLGKVNYENNNIGFNIAAENCRGHFFKKHLDFAIKYALKYSGIDPVLQELAEGCIKEIKADYKEFIKE
ncbi:MAG: hypothetical protein AAB881_01475 [Patescibacteria group bacterium]